MAGRLEGKGLVVVAAIMQHSPQVLISRAEDNIRSPHDLIGKRVALDEAALVSEIRVMLEREDVPINKIVVVGGREALELLRKIDPEVRAIVSSDYSQDSSWLIIVRTVL